MIEMQPVTSSQIAAIGHDPETNKLRVQFHSGSLYEYDDVPASTFNSLLNADSPGKHFGAHIRGRHAYRKVTT